MLCFASPASPMSFSLHWAIVLVSFQSDEFIKIWDEKQAKSETRKGNDRAAAPIGKSPFVLAHMAARVVASASADEIGAIHCGQRQCE